MATETSQFTSPVQIRSGTTVLLAGLLSAMVSGSIALSGYLHFDTSLVTNPAIKTGTSAIIQSYDGQTATVATSSGGRVNYTSMSWTNPSTGTQSLLQFKVDVNKAPVGSNDLSCAIGPPGFTNSGTAVVSQSSATFLFKHKGTSSGVTLTASGNNLPTVLPPNWGGRCWWLVAPGSGVKAKARILTSDQYVP